MSFLDIFKKKKEEKAVGGTEDFMTLITVYFQSTLATNIGVPNIAAYKEMMAFKRSLHVATVNNKLGIGEKKACKKLLQDIYGISDNFFKEIDQSVKKNCKSQTQVQNYFLTFQNYSQNLMMLMGNLLKWKFRIPAFLKKLVKSVVENTVHDVFTKNNWSDPGVTKTVFAVRQYQEKLGFSEDWAKEFVYNVIVLAKKEGTPSEEEVAKAEAKMKK